MKVYPTDALRNIALVGDGGAGKTSLVEALACASGKLPRMGSVEEGNCLTDYSPEEIEHQVSVDLAVAILEWEGTKVNLLDTPGYLDFVGQVQAGLVAADSILVVVSAVDGVGVGTDQIWELARKGGKPALFFVTQMDKETAEFEQVVAQIKRRLADRAVPLVIPVGKGPEFKGVLGLLTGKAHLYAGGAGGAVEAGEIPSEMEGVFNRARQELVETVAETDDVLLERYLEGEKLSAEEIQGALHQGVKEGTVYPILCGAPTEGKGVRDLLDAMVRLLPHPGELSPLALDGGDEGVSLEVKDEAPLAVRVFRTASEAHVGDLFYFRIFSGKIDTGDTIYNVTRSQGERVSHLAVPHGGSQEEVETLHAGDIGVVAKLKATRTGDTLGDKSNPVELPPISFREPVIAVAIKPLAKDDEEKIANGLHRLQNEDPTFTSHYDAELRQTVVQGMGELHLSVVMERLKRKFGVSVELSRPKIPYRETIRKPAEAQGKYKRQTGGRGQYGDAWVKLEPLERGSGYEFADEIVGGVIPNKYIPAVDSGIEEAAQRGILAGYPVVDFRVGLYDGSYHSVDSSDMAFKIAGSMAFQNAAKKADLYLLEPIMEVEVITPEEYVGDVIGDLNGRRGRILGIDSADGRQIIRAQVPQAELYKYSTHLRSITQGRGAHRIRFLGYEEVPPDQAQRLIAERQAEKGRE